MIKKKIKMLLDQHGLRGLISNWSLKNQLKILNLGNNFTYYRPKHLGLTIATASSEGSFRIYESVDLMNL
jgi:hypothetical protein